jgi:hypothetical protein
MAHTPVNHPLRPVYRTLAGLVGLFFVLFGIAGIFRTAGHAPFAKGAPHTLGLGSNLGWSIIILLVGIAILVSLVLGNNRDCTVEWYVGWGLVAIGTIMLALLQTPADILNFSLATVVVSYLTALILIMASLYSKVAPPERANVPQPERQEQHTP